MYKIIWIILILLWGIFSTSTALADLRLESVDPNQSKLTLPLETTLTGTGFDENTRISMFLDIGNSERIIGHWETAGEITGLAVAGDYAYLADFWEGLRVIDVTDPYHPKQISFVQIPGRAIRLGIVKDDFVYLLSWGEGFEAIHVIDVGEPANPNLLSTLGMPIPPCDLVTEGDYAYVAMMNRGLMIMDIRNPFAPEIITFKNMVYDSLLEDYNDMVMGVAVKENILYAVNRGNNRLYVMDLENPSDPQVLSSSISVSSDSIKVRVLGNLAFITNIMSEGLKIVDISTPSDPKTITTVTQDVLGNCYHVALDGDKAYVAAAAWGLQVIDVKDPHNPLIIASADTPGKAQEVFVTGDLAYVADGKGGLQIIDLKSVGDWNPNFISRLNTEGTAKGVTLKGSVLYVADSKSLQITDVGDKAKPKVIASLNTPGSATQVVVENEIAYVADGEAGLQIIDVKDPYNLIRIGFAETPGHAVDLTVADGIAYVSDESGGLQLIDIRESSAPNVMATLETKYAVLDAAISGKTAYVAIGDGKDHGGLRIVDVTNPKAPTVIGRLDAEKSAVGVEVMDNIVYLADTEGLKIIDVSDPSTPIVKCHTAISGTARGLTLANETAYIPYTAIWDDGLHVIDVTSSTAPAFITSFSLPEEANDVSVIGDTAYIACGHLVITPVPVRIASNKISKVDKTNLSVTLPAPRLAGNYTLKVFNETEQDVLTGGITFSGQPVSKAIIVAGCGPVRVDGTNNAIWSETQRCADYAYRTLLDRKYPKENIRYLSSATNTDIDGDGTPDVHGDATSLNLSDAVSSWANIPDNPADELLIYMIDHGGDGTFEINGKNKEELQATDLDNWLDDLQETLPGRLIVIYEACHSGTFLPLLRPPDGKGRILITSTSSHEESHFPPMGGPGLEGILSFSYQFWDRIRDGYELSPAFFFAQDLMRTYQTAQLDSDGNGEGNEYDKEDFERIENIVIGVPTAPASSIPHINEVSGEQRLNGEESATIWAVPDTDANGVWAVITPPDYVPESPDTPVTDLPTLELTDSDNDGRYEGVYDNFAAKGTYNINIYATDTGGTCSLPAQTTVIQTCLKGDMNGNDALDLADVIIALKALSDETYLFQIQTECVREIKMEEVILVLRSLTGTP